MKRSNLDLLLCPACRSHLDFWGGSGERVASGMLACPECHVTYPIVEGVPQLLAPATLTGFNRRFAAMYDWFSWFYPAFSTIAFALIGMRESDGRRQVTDRLAPHGKQVLEVSVGPGGNLPYLLNRQDVGGVIGMDISPGQIRHCQRLIRKRGWDVDLVLGNAEQLPFMDDSFGGILHLGGINFFNDKQAAIREMIRVAMPGSRIVIVDENEKGARWYEHVIPGFKGSFQQGREMVSAPLDLVPPEMHDISLSNIWKGWFYCLEFQKP
ncbi:MAG TPA: methyltransferase domain-containing protein [Anaerolineaceae bacterium]|nr:methyltransferase domain-containing protein [Anaerolineaceae bacterium]